MSNKQFVPRTMKSAFGPYAKLHVEKSKFSAANYILPLAVLVVYAVWLYVMLAGMK
jgi:hypothetical protein